MFVKLLDHWGRETSHNDRFQWYTYMPSSLELDNHHYYFFPIFMSDLYSEGQEPVPNITGSKCPHSILTLGLISCLTEKAVLFLPYYQSLLISCHSFHKIIWVLLGLACSWKCSPSIILLGKIMNPIDVRQGIHSNPADLFTLSFRLWAWAEALTEWSARVDLLAVLICFVSATSLSIN